MSESSEIGTSQYPQAPQGERLVSLVPGLTRSIEHAGGYSSTIYETPQYPKYGLAKFIPPTRLAWGVNLDGEERGFIEMKKVTGVKLNDVWDLDPRIAADMDVLLAGALAMGMDNLDLTTGVRRIPDIINSSGFINIVIGTTDVNPQQQPYIIDTYPSSLQRDYERETWKHALAILSGDSNRFPYPSTHRKLDEFYSSPQLA